jgi:hypothetical protein
LLDVAVYGRGACSFLGAFHPFYGLYSYVIVNAELQSTWNEATTEGLRKTMKIF